MQIIFVEQTSYLATCLDGAEAMPLSYQKFSVWLVCEAGMNLAIIITNVIFLALRALFEQKGIMTMETISRTHTEETDYIVA
jgi:hypothetical protein